MKRILFKSAISAVVAVLFPVVMNIQILMDPGSSVLSDGTPDDAPVRAAAILLAISPLFFLGFAFYFACLGWVLKRVRAVGFAPLFFSVVFSTIVVGLFAAMEMSIPDSPKDAWYSFCMGGLVAFLCFGSGTLVYWWLTRREAS